MKIFDTEIVMHWNLNFISADKYIHFSIIKGFIKKLVLKVYSTLQLFQIEKKNTNF